VKAWSLRVGIAAVSGLCGLTFASCSNNGTPPKNATSTGTESHTKSVSGTSTTSTTGIPYSASKNARSDVTTNGTCIHEPNNSWVLYGSVVNPTDNTTGFTIVVDFVTQPGNTVLDTQIVNVPPVAPHKSTTWGAAWVNPNTAVGCVIRQAQYS
jgi:hypothetical protein